MYKSEVPGQRMRIYVGIVAVAAGIGFGQPEATVRKFDVASVKRSSTSGGFGGMLGGPGSTDPGRLSWTGVTLKVVLIEAYGVKGFQVKGPEWLDTEHFDIIANIPPRSSRADLKLMLIELMKDRFALQAHRETRAMSGYELRVGKNGAKLTPSPTGGKASVPPPPGTIFMLNELDKAGFRVLPEGRPGLAGRILDGRMLMTARMQTLANIVNF